MPRGSGSKFNISTGAQIIQVAKVRMAWDIWIGNWYACDKKILMHKIKNVPLPTKTDIKTSFKWLEYF